jgi:hypothetical protein
VYHPKKKNIKKNITPKTAKKTSTLAEKNTLVSKKFTRAYFPHKKHANP